MTPVEKTESGVIVIRRRMRKKTVMEMTKEAVSNIEPTYESEKPRNPLEFTKTSYGKLIQAVPLWINLSIPLEHIFELFGEPTQITNDRLEWCLKLVNRQVIKIVVKGRNVSIWGFHKTSIVEKWVQRFLST